VQIYVVEYRSTNLRDRIS